LPISAINLFLRLSAQLSIPAKIDPGICAKLFELALAERRHANLVIAAIDSNAELSILASADRDPLCEIKVDLHILLEHVDAEQCKLRHFKPSVSDIANLQIRRERDQNFVRRVL
jgi:hypothetical protein